MYLLCCVALLQSRYPSQLVSKLETAIVQDRVGEFSLYVIDPKTLFRTAVTAESIRVLSDVIVKRKDVRTDPHYLESFGSALRQTKFFELQSSSLDVRYGFEVKDVKGMEILYICMSGEGSLVLIDSRKYRAVGKLGQWLEKSGRIALRTLR